MHPTINQVGAAICSALASKSSRSSLSKKTREIDVHTKPRDASGNIKSSVSQIYVDIVSFGLMREKKVK